MRRRWLKKGIALILSIGVLAGCLAGCGSNGKEDETKAPATNAPATNAPTSVGKEEETKAPEFDARAICEGVTLTIAVPEVTRISDWNENDMTKMVEEALGVNLEFEVYPAADFESKITAMVMGGGELPDIIIKAGLKSYQTWAEEGALLELSKYYADPNFAANIQAGSKELGMDLATYMKNGNGEIYALPQIEQSLERPVKQRFWIYEPWVKALGKDMPETIEEFYELCLLVHEKDMNGNGDTTDEIIMIGNGLNSGSGNGEWFEVLMSAFVYAYDPNFFVVNDGKISLAYTSEEWKEGLLYIKEKFFDTGILGEDLFTNNADPVNAAFASETQVLFAHLGWQKNAVDGIYQPVAGLTNEDGENGKSYYMPVLPTSAAHITTDCKNPDAAFLVCDFLCSEEMSIITRYGREGEDWAYWEDAVKAADFDKNAWVADGGEDVEISWVAEAHAKTFWGDSASTDKSWLQNGPWIRTAELIKKHGDKILDPSTTDEITLANKKAGIESVALAMANREEEVFDFAPLTTDENKAIADITATVKSYVKEMTADFLLGRKDIEVEWDSYLAELTKIGAEEMLATYQAAYNRVH